MPALFATRHLSLSVPADPNCSIKMRRRDYLFAVECCRDVYRAVMCLLVMEDRRGDGVALETLSLFVWGELRDAEAVAGLVWETNAKLVKVGYPHAGVIRAGRFYLP